MPTYHTQPSPTWRDKFIQRELRLIADARSYAENDRVGLPPSCRWAALVMLVYHRSEALDTPPLHEVSPQWFRLLEAFLEEVAIGKAVGFTDNDSREYWNLKYRRWEMEHAPRFTERALSP